MNLNYRLSEDVYLSYLQAKRRRAMARPFSRVMTCVMCLMPLILLFWAFKADMFSGAGGAAVAVLAVVLSVANLLFRLNYWRFAPSELKALKKQASFNEKLSKEHKLRADENGFKISCGDSEASFSWDSYEGIEYMGELVLPVFSGSAADVIPLSALDKLGEADSFEDRLASLAAAALRSSVREHAAADAGIVPLCTLEYDYSEASYLRDQTEARRARYLTSVPYNKSFFARLSLTGVMLYAVFAVSLSPWMVAVCICFAIVFSLAVIADFSPYLPYSLKKMLAPTLALKPDIHAGLRLTEDRIIVEGDIHYLVIPYSEVLAYRRTKHCAALYLASDTILTVPAPPETGSEAFSCFCLYVSKKV